MSLAEDVSPRQIARPRVAPRGWSAIPVALRSFLTIQAVAWIVVPSLVFRVPHSSTLDVSMWSRDWYLVNYQHPALAGWLIQAAYWLFGDHLWVTFLMSQLCIAATYLFVFLLGRDALGQERGLLGTLILSVVPFFNYATLQYNENMVQLPFWAAFCYGLWHASQSDRKSWWCFTAVVAALGVYSKFSMTMVIAFGTCWVLIDPSGRRCLRRAPLYLAIGLFILLVSPLAAALIETHFGAVKWIGSESSRRGVAAASMAIKEGKTALIMAAIALVPVLIARWRPSTVPPSARPPIARPAIAYLLLMGGGPLLLTLLIGLFMPVRNEWASPMYSLVGLLIAAALPDLRGSAPARLALLGTALVISLGALAIDSRSVYQDRSDTKVLRKYGWPGPAISQRLDAIWHAKIGMPLRIVGGDVWVAGLAGFFSADRPSLFPELDLTLWPGGTEARVRHDGVLALWVPGSAWQPSAALLQRYAHGQESFRWSDDPAAKPLEVDYLIIPPVGWTPAIRGDDSPG